MVCLRGSLAFLLTVAIAVSAIASENGRTERLGDSRAKYVQFADLFYAPMQARFDSGRSGAILEMAATRLKSVPNAAVILLDGYRSTRTPRNVVQRRLAFACSYLIEGLGVDPGQVTLRWFPPADSTQTTKSSDRIEVYLVLRGQSVLSIRRLNPAPTWEPVVAQ